jgi:hypothetical protein
MEEGPMVAEHMVDMVLARTIDRRELLEKSL